MRQSVLFQTILWAGSVTIYGGRCENLPGLRVAPVIKLPTVNGVASQKNDNQVVNPNLQPATQPIADLKDGCKKTYDDRSLVLGFENLRPPCLFNECITIESLKLSHERGSGATWFGETTAPIMYENAFNWHAINCNAEKYKGNPESEICGGSGKGLWTPGKSTDDEKVPARFNTNKFPDQYLYFDLKSLFITPLIDIPDQTTVVVTISGKRKDGPEVLHVAKEVANKERVGISFPINLFNNILSFDIAVQVGGTSSAGEKLWPFGLDDVAIVEHVPKVLPSSCTPKPKPTGIRGPCPPEPTQTKKVTAKADELKAVYGKLGAAVPKTYMGINWPSEISVHNRSTINDEIERFWPGIPKPSSMSNFFHGVGEVTWVATTQEERFGLEEISMLCSFRKGNGEPCEFTFVGRRDPYDGSGLPALVQAKYTFKNPNGAGGDRPFTKINLNKLTNIPGAFRRLVRLSIFVDVPHTPTYTHFVFDDVKFLKELGEGERCRVPGTKVMNFDDLKPGSFVPTTYQGFKFVEGALQVTEQKQYAPGEPGYYAVKSAPNAAKSQRGFEMNRPLSIDSFISPSKEFLFDLESVTLTVDIDLKNKTALDSYSFSIVATDACGMNTSQLGSFQERIPWYNWMALEKGKSQVVVNYPFKAVSKITISGFFDPKSSFYGGVTGFWIDDFKYRKYNGKTPGCARCGYKSLYHCEVPAVQR